ncbi:MAG: S41 family peptidase [Thermodesulfovibrionales bacterium]|nr:S41 family peptidase [Thermodesulfovibrionales bacterium]
MIVALGGVFIGRLSIGSMRAEGEGYEYLKVFTEVLSIVKKNYVEEVKTKDLIYGAIKGMLNSLDPHSAYMPPEAYKDMQLETKGEFGGIGIQIGIKDGVLTVIAPIEDTPAYNAGIKAGDKIIKVNGESTRDMGLHDAVSKMRGQKGTSVSITIMREGWKDTKDFTIVRDIIKVKSVKSKVIEGNIGYVKLSQFQERTADDLEAALFKLEKQNITSLILDLRNNPGGLLNSAVDVSSQFLPAGKVVVSIKGRSGEKGEYRTEDSKVSEQEAKKAKMFSAIPMIVLVNQGSASASEIVAGALKDWNRAVILGVQTFGKGSVQSVVPLSDGSGLKLTTARYYTPKGISIQSTGITPDIIVKLEQKNGAKEHTVVREKDLERHLKNDQLEEKPKTPEETAPIEVSEKDDIQLQRAIDLLKTWKVFKELPKAA